MVGGVFDSPPRQRREPVDSGHRHPAAGERGRCLGMDADHRAREHRLPCGQWPLAMLDIDSVRLTPFLQASAGAHFVGDEGAEPVSSAAVIHRRRQVTLPRALLAGRLEHNS